MTDKEILIDGVNVAECKFHSMYDTVYKKGYCKCHNVSCLLNKGCDFKQLAREKQKNTKLQEQLEAQQPTGICDICQTKLHDENLELKQKNEELEKENEFLENWLNDSFNFLKTRLGDKYDFAVEANKYSQALKEIREIAENIVEKDVYENSDIKAQRIIDKIDEVLNEG